MMDMVHIVWTDAVTSAEAGWTIGFVLHENTEWISLTDSVGGDEFGQITKIPKSMIVDLVHLMKEDRRYEECDILGDISM